MKFISIYFSIFKLVLTQLLFCTCLEEAYHRNKLVIRIKSSCTRPSCGEGRGMPLTLPQGGLSTVTILDVQEQDSLLSFSKIMWVSWELKLLQPHVGMSSWRWFGCLVLVTAHHCMLQLLSGYDNILNVSHLPQWIHTYNQTMKVLIVLIEYTFRFQVKYQRYIKTQGTSKPERDAEKFFLIILFSHDIILKKIDIMKLYFLD